MNSIKTLSKHPETQLTYQGSLFLFSELNILLYFFSPFRRAGGLSKYITDLFDCFLKFASQEQQSFTKNIGEKLS